MYIFDYLNIYCFYYCYYCRLATAQEQISLLKDEITRLKASTNSVKGTVTIEADNHDLKWRLQQLQQQYDYTVSKLTALSESSKHSEVKLEVHYYCFIYVS